MLLSSGGWYLFDVKEAVQIWMISREEANWKIKKEKKPRYPMLTWYCLFPGIVDRTYQGDRTGCVLSWDLPLRYLLLWFLLPTHLQPAVCGYSADFLCPDNPRERYSSYTLRCHSPFNENSVEQHPWIEDDSGSIGRTFFPYLRSKVTQNNCAWVGLNQGPSDLQFTTLPTELPNHHTIQH